MQQNIAVLLSVSVSVQGSDAVTSFVLNSPPPPPYTPPLLAYWASVAHLCKTIIYPRTQCGGRGPDIAAEKSGVAVVQTAAITTPAPAPRLLCREGV